MISYLVMHYVIAFMIGTIFWFGVMNFASDFISPLLVGSGKKGCQRLLLLSTYLISIVTVVGMGERTWRHGSLSYPNGPTSFNDFLAVFQMGMFSVGTTILAIIGMLLLIGIVQHVNLNIALKLCSPEESS